MQAAEQRAQDFDTKAASLEEVGGRGAGGGVLGTVFKSIAGTAKGTRKQQQVEEVVEEVAAAKRGGGLFGGQHARQAKTGAGEGKAVQGALSSKPAPYCTKLWPDGQPNPERLLRAIHALPTSHWPLHYPLASRHE